MISHNINNLHDGDFPIFKTMKDRHPDWKHYVIVRDTLGYQHKMIIYKEDEDLKKDWKGSELPNFLLSEKTFEIYRYDGEFSEKHYGAEIVFGSAGRNPTTYHFDHMEDANRFIKVMSEACRRRK